MSTDDMYSSDEDHVDEGDTTISPPRPEAPMDNGTHIKNIVKNPFTPSPVNDHEGGGATKKGIPTVAVGDVKVFTGNEKIPYIRDSNSDNQTANGSVAALQTPTNVGFSGSPTKYSNSTGSKSSKGNLSSNNVNDSLNSSSGSIGKQLVQNALNRPHPRGATVSKRERVRKGRWKQGNKIGNGSFGTVYMGMNESSGEQAASTNKGTKGKIE